jgi:hypothetical protein
MDIKQLAKKPQLVQIVIDEADIVSAYGEPVTFYMRDFVDINTYFEFFKSQGEKNGDSLTKILTQIILNKDGEPVLAEDEKLPIDISVAALTKINETLGKSNPKSLTPSNGTQSS